MCSFPVTASLVCAGGVSAGDVWLHPGCDACPLNLFDTFDQQTVVRLRDGRLMTVHEEGNATFLSTDNGQTWSAPIPMRESPDPVLPTRGPLILTRGDTLVMMFQCMSGMSERWDENTRDWTDAFHSDLWVMRSTDNGRNWDTPTKPCDGIYGTIVDTIQTADGHIVVPVEVVLRKPGRWGVYVFISGDDGVTWTRSNLLDIGGNGHHDGAIEPTLTELSNGQLYMLIRTGFDGFWETRSDDSGLTWTDPCPSRIDASGAPGQLKRLASGRLALVWNRLYPEGKTEASRHGPSAAYGRPVSGHRQELSIAFSDDDARTWTEPVVIARNPKGSLAYPFIFEAKLGELWMWTRYGSKPPACLRLREQDFVGA